MSRKLGRFQLARAHVPVSADDDGTVQCLSSKAQLLQQSAVAPSSALARAQAHVEDMQADRHLGYIKKNVLHSVR
eukprot:291535-Pyramimonas_sp.AAC.1